MTSEQRTPVTIGDVAEAAGVSKAAVSGVINGKSRVSANTTARIEAAIQELGYQSNPTARLLRAGRSDAIGLVVPELDRPYFGELSSIIADAVGDSGKHLVVQRSGGTHEAEFAAASFARLRMYDGVIFSVVDIDPARLENLQFSTPVVLIGERSGENRFDHVAMDNVGGALMATTHLLERGARRIALVGGDRASLASNAEVVEPTVSPTLGGELVAAPGAIQMTKLRTQGYVDALRAAGLDVDPDLVVGLDNFSYELGRLAVHDLVARGTEFDAVFAVTDVVAIGALRGLAEAGRRVPQDVQVIGFDDIAEGAYSTPALSTVNPNKHAIAKTAVELLDERLEGSQTQPREIIVPTELKLRESTRSLD